MNLWYQKLGFSYNPFSIKPAVFQDEIVAYNMPYVYEMIDNSEMVFIEGEYGTGKTSILKNIINTFRGRNKIIYYSFNQGRNFNVQGLLEGANSLLRKLSGLKVKNVILLLDEVQSMKASDAKEILPYYEDGTIKSVVFVSHDYDAVKVPKDIESYMNGNILRTIEFSNNEAVEFVRRRIGDVSVLSDEHIIRIFKIANKNPRRLLEYCEDICKFAVEMGDDKVGEYHIEEILGDVEKSRKTVKKKAKKKKSSGTKKSEQEKKIEQKPVESVKIEEPGEELAAEHETKAEENVAVEEAKSAKKYKVNKLVADAKKDALGTVSEKEEEEVPEYNVFRYSAD